MPSGGLGADHFRRAAAFFLAWIFAHAAYAETLTDANAEQVRQGMAWVFERYARRGSPLYAIQDEAKAAGRGLWRDLNPVPPWEWRRRQRDRSQPSR